MATAKRERVPQTTKPSISAGNSNIQGSRDGRSRKGSQFKHGVTPDAAVVDPDKQWHPSFTDPNSDMDKPIVTKGTKFGRRG